MLDSVFYPEIFYRAVVALYETKPTYIHFDVSTILHINSWAACKDKGSVYTGTYFVAVLKSACGEYLLPSSLARGI